MSDHMITFLITPGAECGDPVETKLLREHEAEASRRRATFWNYAKCLYDYGIHSKTSRGHLASSIDPKTNEVRHHWTRYSD
jgi:hypothetical protein